MTSDRVIVTVCDDCLNVAYDEGIEGWEAQAATMRDAGDIIEDHLCIEMEEPEIKCGCACRGGLNEDNPRIER
jgi:hypothetical protein